MINAFSFRSSHRFAIGSPLVLTLALAASAWAQPDLDTPGKATNPANRAPRRLQNNPRANLRRDDPNERIRRQFKQLGITDPSQQDALSTYIQGEALARAALVEKGRDLSLKLRAAALTDTQTLGLLNTYNAAIDDDKARRETALATLKKSIDFSKNPKIETYLTLLGFYGDGPAVLNSVPTRQMEMLRGGALRGGGAAPPVVGGAQTPPVLAAPVAPPVPQ